MKHQYDFDAATAIGFLRQYGLDKDFKMNIEANHATLAGHTFRHELRISAINGMLGSIDANQGDCRRLLLGGSILIEHSTKCQGREAHLRRNGV